MHRMPRRRNPWEIVLQYLQNWKEETAYTSFMRRSSYDNDTRKCTECPDEGSHGKLFCSICTEWKDKTAYSARMRENRSDESARKCLDCMSPVCQYPSCRTCKTCRNPECKKRKTARKTCSHLTPNKSRRQRMLWTTSVAATVDQLASDLQTMPII